MSVPPLQLNALFSVTAPVPFNVPAERFSVFAVSAPFAVSVPPAIESVPATDDALVCVRVPPVSEKISSPRNANDFGVCAALRTLMVWVPARLGICASSPAPGSCPRLQFVPMLQSPPAALVQISSELVPKVNDVAP